MNTDPQSEPMPDWRDPFSEPNTLPGGWNLSDPTPASQPGAAATPERPVSFTQPAYELTLHLN